MVMRSQARDNKFIVALEGLEPKRTAIEAG